MAEYLYPDIKTVGRCLGTAAVSEVAPEEIGLIFSYEWHEASFMNTGIFFREEAKKYRSLYNSAAKVNGMEISIDFVRNKMI